MTSYMINLYMAGSTTTYWFINTSLPSLLLRLCMTEQTWSSRSEQMKFNQTSIVYYKGVAHLKPFILFSVHYWLTQCSTDDAVCSRCFSFSINSSTSNNASIHTLPCHFTIINLPSIACSFPVFRSTASAWNFLPLQESALGFRAFAKKKKKTSPF